MIDLVHPRPLGVEKCYLIEVKYDPLVRGHYSYDVREVNLEAKLQYAGWSNGGGVSEGAESEEEGSAGPSRVRLDLHGIQLVFKQSGGLDVFDYKTCVLALISSLVLLSTASKVTDYFLIYTSCLPGCKDYATHIYEQSPLLTPRTPSGRKRLRKILNEKVREQAELRDLDCVEAASSRRSSSADAGAVIGDSGAPTPINAAGSTQTQSLLTRDGTV